MEYFQSEGKMVNPRGGVEAIFTHALSLLFNLPTAHSPMLESEDIEELDTGVVDPRMAAETVSYTFLQCILKGLQRSPRILSDFSLQSAQPGVLSVNDVSCVVIPDGCIGLPTLAALKQGIPVIAIRENRTLMKNDLSALPWAPGQFFIAENYLEAVGIMSAMKSGTAIESIRRPIKAAPLTICSFTKPRRKKPVLEDIIIQDIHPSIPLNDSSSLQYPLIARSSDTDE